MSRDTQETVELRMDRVTRAMAKSLPEEAEEKVVLLEEKFNGLAWYMHKDK